MKSFWDLGSTRRYDMGPIPWDKIVEYGHYIGLYDDLIDAFVALIRAMDAGYIEWAVKQVKRGRAQEANGDLGNRTVNK